MPRKQNNNSTPAKILRCAIYTRKSTEEGLEQEFNSLDAQRESGEAYIKAQTHEGWRMVEDHYDDGGFTGGNMERPALKRLMADIEAGKIDCVVVYKVDRLSRSLMDFARMMEVFEKYNVAFVSVTQQFNTSNSMGRLMLNVLLSFAQFERELISERTRDKIAAARRKGRYAGGRAVLGYDVRDTKLIVNEEEAKQVREIYELYLKQPSLLETAKELNRRKWTTKGWTTKAGKSFGGVEFTKTRLHLLLTNVTYIGKVRYKEEVHPGQHEAIVDEATFLKVQSKLKRSTTKALSKGRNKYGALLRGLLRCKHCDCAMMHNYSVRHRRRYRYYVCHCAQQKGWDQCPNPSLPAGEIEDFVVEQVKQLATGPEVLKATLAEVRRRANVNIERLEADQVKLKEQLERDQARLAEMPVDSTDVDAWERRCKLEVTVAGATKRYRAITDDLLAARTSTLSEADVRAALADFGNVWDSLIEKEQARLLELFVEQVAYDGQAGKIAISYRQLDPKLLLAGLPASQEVAS